jgi:chorismate synthase
MLGNTIGFAFRVTTWGESHGPAIGTVIDGCPPGMNLTENDIQVELDRRKPGQAPSSSPRKEADRVEIASGVFEGKTTGTPIALIIRNADADSVAYDHLREIYRPGHADFTYDKKYGIRDHRGGGRSSGRETAARVAAGAVARKIIVREGITVRAVTMEIGGIAAKKFFLREVDKNRLLCPDTKAAAQMEKRLEQARKKGDSLGGIVSIIVRGCPAGLGEPVFGKIDADLAGALMSIGTVKGVEIGDGFQSARMLGSEHNDTLTRRGFATNHAGGILGGITTGEDILIRLACKPIPSIGQDQKTIDRRGRTTVLSIKGRHDVCVIPRINPVCEAMVSIVLADHFLRQKAMEYRNQEDRN